jgi:ribosome maturation factor RimP
MRYTPKDVGAGDAADVLRDSLEPVAGGLGLSIVELTVSRHKGSAQVRAIVYKPVSGQPTIGGQGAMGVDDCSRAHHAILPRLELAFPGEDLSVEVSSPGIDRLIRDAAEFPLWLGRGLRCFMTDTSEWVGGILRRADAGGISLEGKDGSVDLDCALIAKAKLDHSLE